MSLSGNPKALRSEKGYTYVELSNKSGVSTGCICDLENGKVSNPSLETLVQLTNALGVKVERLIADDTQAAS